MKRIFLLALLIISFTAILASAEEITITTIMSGAEAHREVIKYLSANIDIPNTGTDLQFAIAPNEIWQIEMELYINLPAPAKSAQDEAANIVLGGIESIGSLGWAGLSGGYNARILLSSNGNFEKSSFFTKPLTKGDYTFPLLTEKGNPFNYAFLITITGIIYNGSTQIVFKPTFTKAVTGDAYIKEGSYLKARYIGTH